MWVGRVRSGSSLWRPADKDPQNTAPPRLAPGPKKLAQQVASVTASPIFCDWPSASGVRRSRSPAANIAEEAWHTQRRGNITQIGHRQIRSGRIVCPETRGRCPPQWPVIRRLASRAARSSGRDRVAQRGVTRKIPGPAGFSLLAGKKQGISSILASVIPHMASKKPSRSITHSQIPYAPEQGIDGAVAGNLVRTSGKSSVGSGKTHTSSCPSVNDQLA